MSGDVTDIAWLTDHLTRFDGAIHAATPGDATSADFDAGIVDAVQQAYSGSGRPYVHTGGVWVYGSNADITEDSPLNPPALVAWRPAVEQSLLASGVAASIVAPGIIHGYGKGIPALPASGPREADGSLIMIGDGRQHWTTVHVDDLADLYVLLLERGSGEGRVLGVSGHNPTVGELAGAIAGRGRAESPAASRDRLGPDFADALLLDQQASGDRARSLGWTPTRPNLLAELTT